MLFKVLAEAPSSGELVKCKKGIHTVYVARCPINRGYYTAVRRYEFYFRVVKYCFLPREKAGNDVIDILTSEDMENTPLESRMLFRMNFTSGLFSTKALLSI